MFLAPSDTHMFVQLQAQAMCSMSETRIALDGDSSSERNRYRLLLDITAAHRLENQELLSRKTGIYYQSVLYVSEPVAKPRSGTKRELRVERRLTLRRHP
jgi:hypothetical protein